MLHSACQEDYKTLAAVAVAYGHVLVAESPIDLNIAKQLNILLSRCERRPRSRADRSADRRPRLRPGVHLLGDGADPARGARRAIRC